MDSSAEGSEVDGEMMSLVPKNAEDQGFVVGDEVEQLQNRYTETCLYCWLIKLVDSSNKMT